MVGAMVVEGAATTGEYRPASPSNTMPTIANLLIQVPRRFEVLIQKPLQRARHGTNLQDQASKNRHSSRFRYWLPEDPVNAKLTSDQIRPSDQRRSYSISEALFHFRVKKEFRLWCWETPHAAPIWKLSYGTPRPDKFTLLCP